jgi:hypothetical protein
VTVIHSIASAQPGVTTLHLIVHELLVFFGSPVAIEVPALRGGGARATKINGFWIDCSNNRLAGEVLQAQVSMNEESGRHHWTIGVGIGVFSLNIAFFHCLSSPLKPKPL